MKSFRKYRDDHLSHHAHNGDYEHDAEFGLIEKFGLHDPINRRTILRHVIVPLTGHRLLDRTLVYTAVTRAQRQVLLVGDEAAAKTAVEGQPRAQTRQVSLDLHIASIVR